MKELGFEHLKSEAGIFHYKKKDTDLIIAVVYVDNIFFCGPDKAILNEIKSKFIAKWKCKDLEALTEFLQMHIIQRDQQICINQSDYLRKVLQKFHMQDA